MTMMFFLFPSSRQTRRTIWSGVSVNGLFSLFCLSSCLVILPADTRSRSLNPKWFEGLLKHGHEGVRQIEAQVTNTLGWSATTGQVDPWVYQRLTETFVLDEEMRRRLAALNPQASARMANRLLEAHERNYWQPDEATLAALQAGADELEDTLEGLNVAAE